MNHTLEIRKAIQFAARKHHGQMRVASIEGPLPYIIHPFSVALLVAENNTDDDVAIAALLHDTLEDTETTYKEIVESFNTRIADLVESVSEVKEKNGIPYNWKDRKLNYLERLESSSVDAILISVADKIDNIESKIDSFERGGEIILTRWKQASKEYCWYHGEVLSIAERRLPGHLLTRRFVEVYAREKEVFL